MNTNTPSVHKSQADVNAPSKEDEFLRLFKLFRDHLDAEGIELSDYEVGHLAVICREELTTQRGELHKNIGLLRQYLNERSSKELITSAELEHWLLPTTRGEGG